MGAGQFSGFVKLHRQIRQSAVWHLPSTHKVVWLTCLVLANWQEGETWFDGREEHVLRRGEFITSQQNLATECGSGDVTRRVVQRALANLARLKMVKVVAGRSSAFTLIRVIKYDTYQDLPESAVQQRSSGGAAAVQQRCTGKEGKKGRREEDSNVDGEPSTASPQAALFSGSDPVPAPPTNGTGTSSITKRVMDYVNKKRNGSAPSTLGWQPYLKLVKRALGAGHTEKELKLVVWWAAEHEWPLSDPDHTKRVHPSTLFPIAKSSGYRALPQYLDLAKEKYREVKKQEFNPHDRSDDAERHEAAE